MRLSRRQETGRLGVRRRSAHAGGPIRQRRRCASAESTFPLVLYSSLEDGALTVYRYPNSFELRLARAYSLPQGPAVFGAVNGRAGSHLAWSDPASARLNLLNLETGENRAVVEIGGAYAQYLLLTADASAILIVNLEFAPEVFAWDVETGRRMELGPYRSCQRIPDKVSAQRGRDCAYHRL